MLQYYTTIILQFLFGDKFSIILKSFVRASESFVLILKKNTLEPLYIYSLVAFVAGFLIAWLLRLVTILPLKKSNKSLAGYLESEKLRKETLLKENTSLHETKRLLNETHEARLKALQQLATRQDEDILLLQKSNEETESLLEAGQPVIHSLKMQLIEAQNTIARYKAQLDKISERVPH